MDRRDFIKALENARDGRAGKQRGCLLGWLHVAADRLKQEMPAAGEDSDLCVQMQDMLWRLGVLIQEHGTLDLPCGPPWADTCGECWDSRMSDTEDRFRLLLQDTDSPD